MWRVRYDHQNGYDGLFSTYELPNGDFDDEWRRSRSESTPASSRPSREEVPWAFGSVYDPGSELEAADVKSDKDPVSYLAWIKQPNLNDDKASIPSVEFKMKDREDSDSVIFTDKSLEPNHMKLNLSNGSLPIKQLEKYHKISDNDDDDEGQEVPKDPNVLLYGNHRPIFWAVFVRVLLVGHNVLTVWRVTEALGSPLYWLLAVLNLFLLLELHVVVVKRAGIEYSWWTPCFLFYLGSTIPSIWLLQLQLYDEVTSSGPGPDVTSVSTSAPSTQFTGFTTQAPTKLAMNNEVWLIIVQEALVYLLVFSRWLLPRGAVSRAFLADLLLEFLAIASDIMELLAVFDEEEIRGNLSLTLAILTVWSASFIQFIPVLVHKRRFRHVRNPKVPCINRYFGDKFVEIVVTLMNIFLQDLPFLIVRLYIVFEIRIITYSLIFFILKNIVSLMLLFYRLTIMGKRLPIVRQCGQRLHCPCSPPSDHHRNTPSFHLPRIDKERSG
ncbi:transmembrane protein 26-like [Mya arenaria]|uniref:transmembrane protein 26-like n=1 Tax=Mya arenaria TaxID=6604 RepID=UPI0022DEE0F7|nr:transmembrane protein 26-like [Mya arenaria]